MDFNLAERRTLTNDDDAFPPGQFWVKDGAVWWDLHYVYMFVKRNALYSMKRYRWLNDIERCVTIDPLTSHAVNFYKSHAVTATYQTAATSTLGLLVHYSYLADNVPPPIHS